FSGDDGQLWDIPQPGTPENLKEAKKFLNHIKGSGGTEMLAGLQRALSARHDPKFLQMYVFLTDGFVAEEEAILRMIREQKKDGKFFAFGIGSSVNRYLIDGIGELGKGRSMVVVPGSENEALRAAQRFFSTIDSPVLADVSIDWTGLPVDQIYPTEIPDL